MIGEECLFGEIIGFRVRAGLNDRGGLREETLLREVCCILIVSALYLNCLDGHCVPVTADLL